MENYFQMNMEKRRIDAISNLGLAHIGDGVYELMCRSYLCAKGDQTVKNLHRDSVALVKAPTQEAAGEICHSCANCDYKEYSYPPALPAPEPVELEVPDSLPVRIWKWLRGERTAEG